MSKRKRIAKLIASAGISLALGAPCLAQQGPPPGFFPPDMPQQFVGDLYETYCNNDGWIFKRSCIRTRVLVYGQVCVPNEDKKDKYPFLEDEIPVGYQYVGWDCDGKIYQGKKLEGK